MKQTLQILSNCKIPISLWVSGREIGGRISHFETDLMKNGHHHFAVSLLYELTAYFAEISGFVTLTPIRPEQSENARVDLEGEIFQALEITVVLLAEILNGQLHAGLLLKFDVADQCYDC